MLNPIIISGDLVTPASAQDLEKIRFILLDIDLKNTVKDTTSWFHKKIKCYGYPCKSLYLRLNICCYNFT